MPDDRHDHRSGSHLSIEEWSRMPRLSRFAVVVFAATAVSLAPAVAAEAGGAQRVDGPMRPKSPAKPLPAASATPRDAKTWTRTPDGHLQWRDGNTSVTVSGSVTVDTVIRSGTR